MSGTSIPTSRGISGVYKIENDLSAVLNPTLAVNVASVIDGNYGPVGEVTRITSESGLAATFGAPTDKNFNVWYNISNTFRYKVNGLGASMMVIRPLVAGMLNGGVGFADAGNAPATPILIKSKRQSVSVTPAFGGGASVNIYTQFPTTKKLFVAIATGVDFDTATYNGKDLFKDNTTLRPSTDKQFVLFVLDVSGNIIESFLASVDGSELDDNNISLGVDSTINERSKYIVGFVKAGATKAPGSTAKVELVGGVVPDATEDDVAGAYKLFNNTDTIHLQYMVGVGDKSFTAMNQLAQDRDDCAFRAGVDVATILGKDESDALVALNDHYKTFPNTTRGSIVGNIGMITDTYNGKKRWISLAGDMIGLRIKQNISKESWFSDGGYNYGVLGSHIERLGQEWAPTSQRELNLMRLNPVIAADGVGFVKTEQRNFTSKDSALRDENVRELLNYIFRTGKVFLKWKLHEFNDAFTRFDIQSKMDRFLANIQAGRGIRRKTDGGDGYKARCDGTNNNSDVINQNMLVLDLSFLPAIAIREIFVRMNVLSSGVQLDVA